MGDITADFVSLVFYGGGGKGGDSKMEDVEKLELGDRVAGQFKKDKKQGHFG